MNTRLAASTDIWRARRPAGAGDRAYIAYSLVMLALIVVTPVVRVLWLWLTTPAVTDALVAPGSAAIASASVLTVWAVALIVGRDRGPALAAPFLVHAWSDSDLRPRVVFRRRVLAAVVVAALLGSVVSAFVGAATGAAGLAPVGLVAESGVRGALVGVIAAVCWLVGESVPRVAGVIAVVVLASAATWVIVPGAAIATFAPATVTAELVVAAGVLLVLVPVLLDRIRAEVLTAQSAKWDAAIAHGVSLDFTAVAAAYQVRAASGRRLRLAIRSLPLWIVFPGRDLVGAARTPARMITGLATIVASAALFVLAVALPAGGALGALSALLLYIGTGAFTRGLEHAAQVSRDLPLYGIGDGRLLLLHSVLPGVVALLVTSGTTVALGAAAAGSGVPGALLLGALGLPVVVVAARLSNALRGPSPVFLMMPAPSALGDPMPLVRVLWALDAPLLAVLAGLAAGGTALVPFVSVAVVIGLVLVVRWRRRD